MLVFFTNMVSNIFDGHLDGNLFRERTLLVKNTNNGFGLYFASIFPFIGTLPLTYVSSILSISHSMCMMDSLAR
jgi:hypothetical protein